MADVSKSESDWKGCLSPEEYRVLRSKGTEAPFTGKLLHNKKKGVYTCAACRNKIFDSKAKFDSGTGWPSFNDAIKGSIKTRVDFKMIIPRVEVMCAKCGSHLGHMFPDGPMPTGKRYCINSVALKFKEKT